MIFSLFVLDFWKWFHHLVRHKVKWFWYFHTIHHSQTEMNLFENDRVHLFDVIIARTIIFIPGYMLGLSVTQLLVVTFLMRWYPYFYHANIRANMGILKYLFVTPQAHRVHHSKVKAHADKNFGVIFIIWDRLFGTYFDGGDEYPETGIEDKDFPLERSMSGWALFSTTIKQFCYPFKCIWRDCTQKSN
jgi:sterol desaturase/sphingolipid hydroxylase (fatty acid hydroxylase superfamily)